MQRATRLRDHRPPPHFRPESARNGVLSFSLAYPKYALIPVLSSCQNFAAFILDTFVEVPTLVVNKRIARSEWQQVFTHELLFVPLHIEAVESASPIFIVHSGNLKCLLLPWEKKNTWRILGF